MADESLILNDKGVAGLLDPDSATDRTERLESMERRLWAAAETFSGQPIELILRPTQPRCPNAHRYVNGVKQPCPTCTTEKQGEAAEAPEFDPAYVNRLALAMFGGEATFASASQLQEAEDVIERFHLHAWAAPQPSVVEGEK